MPLNRGNHISAVIDEILWLKPRTILDVGVGWGLMGVIFRAFTDVRGLKLKKEEWSTQIDGIEIFEPYRNPCWDFYDTIHIGNALAEIDSLGKYEVVYCGDMIEHLTKEDGFELIDKMLEHCERWVYVAVPYPVPDQTEVLGNPSEAHQSKWEEEDFKKYNYELVGMIGWGTAYMLVVRIKPC